MVGFDSRSGLLASSSSEIGCQPHSVLGYGEYLLHDVPTLTLLGIYPFQHSPLKPFPTANGVHNSLKSGPHRPSTYKVQDSQRCVRLSSIICFSQYPCFCTNAVSTFHLVWIVFNIKTGQQKGTIRMRRFLHFGASLQSETFGAGGGRGSRV